MREILFRAKKIVGGKRANEWEYGVPLMSDPNSELAYIKQLNSYEYQVAPETIGQYTGLCDKNGTKIFEGDIIKIRKSTDFYGKPITFKGVVFFNEDECGFTIGKNGMKGYCISSLASYIFKSSVTEIIGNFYDNPELLEE